MQIQVYQREKTGKIGKDQGGGIKTDSRHMIASGETAGEGSRQESNKSL